MSLRVLSHGTFCWLRRANCGGFSTDEVIPFGDTFISNLVEQGYDRISGNAPGETKNDRPQFHPKSYPPQLSPSPLPPSCITHLMSTLYVLRGAVRLQPKCFKHSNFWFESEGLIDRFWSSSKLRPVYGQKWEIFPLKPVRAVKKTDITRHALNIDISPFGRKWLSYRRMRKKKEKVESEGTISGLTIHRICQ